MTKELYIWWKARHKNILSFLGFFIDDHEFLNLVSEWMGNGTLLDYLPKLERGRETLDMVRFSYCTVEIGDS